MTKAELKALLVHPDKATRTKARLELQQRALADPALDQHELAIERNGEKHVLFRPWPDQVPAMDLHMRIPAMLNGYSGHRDHRFRSSRSLIGAKRRRQFVS